MAPFFSVVIPALNEELYIGELLKALSRQTFKDFEVILVDANSTDNTITEAQKFKKQLNLKVLTTNKRNVAISRNLGAKNAIGTYLFFIDADNSIENNFLELAKEKIERENVELIVPAVIPDKKRVLYKLTYNFMNTLVYALKLINIGFSTGGNLVINRMKFYNLGGFNKEIFVAEDHDLVNRAINSKIKTAFMNNTKIIFSTRRLEKEKFRMIGKYVISSIYIVAFGKITKRIYNYQMGGHHYQKKS